MKIAIDFFNRHCPVGSEVTVTLDSGQSLVTKVRAPAELLGGHTPVAWLEGISGAYLLDRVSAAAKGGAR